MSQVEHLPAEPVSQAISRMSKLPAGALRLILVSASCLLAYLPLLLIHFSHMQSRTHYQYYPLIPLGAAALFWMRWPEVDELRGGRTWITALLMSTAIALLTMAIGLYSPWLAMVSFNILLLGTLHALGGISLVHLMLPAWLLLWFLVPLPFDLDNKLIQSLQMLTAAWSSKLLDTIGVMHVMTGNAVEIPNHQLLIEEACSGIQSLFACLTFVVFYLFWFRHPIIRGTLVLLASVGWVLVANALRVVAIAVLTQNGYTKVADGDSWEHMLLGIFVFGFTMLMTLSTDRLLMFVMPPRPVSFGHRHSPGDSLGAEAGTMWYSRTWFTSWQGIPAAAVCLVLLLLQAYLLWPKAHIAADEGWVTRLTNLEQNAMPARIGQWSLTSYSKKAQPRFDADTSQIWVYRHGAKTMYISADMTFPSWHDLRVCYRAIGWDIGKSKLYPPGTDEPLPRMDVSMSQAGFHQAELIFGLYDKQGRPMEQLQDSIWGRVWNRLRHAQENWQASFAGERYFQLQVFVESYDGFSQRDRVELQDIFADLVKRATQQWIAATPSDESAALAN